MRNYGVDRRNPQRQPTRTLTLEQIKQIEATLQDLEREAGRWKELARQWETTAKQEHARASQLEEQLEEQEKQLEEQEKRLQEAGVQPEEAAGQAQPGEAAEERLARMQTNLAQAQADYESAKRRLETRFAHTYEQNIMEFLRDLLPVLDNLERAIQHAPPEAENEGVNLTRQMFLSTLDKYGVKPIAARGTPFNPEFHEALGTTPDNTQAPGTVVHVEQPGYTYRDKLLRPAQVLITPAAD